MAQNFPANPQDGDTYNGHFYSAADDVWRLISSTYATESYVNSNVAGKISNTEKGAAFGVAMLDGDGNVDVTQLEHIIENAPSTLNSFGKIANQFKVYATSQWETNTDILPAGSINVEIDNVNGLVKYKLGDGTHNWSETEYVINDAYLQQELIPILQEIDNLQTDKIDVYGGTFSGNVTVNGDFEVSGQVTMPSVTNIAGATGTEISYLENASSNIQVQLDSKADASDINGLAPLNSPTFTGNVVLPYNTTIGNLTSAEINSLDGISTDLPVQYQLDELAQDMGVAQSNISNLQNQKAPINSPTFTGTVSGITKSMIGLGSVDNTSDLNKPISNATQAALDDKASISGQVFTGDVEAPNLTITGDLYVAGTTTTINTTDYRVRDNMIYLNQAGLFEIENAVGDGSNVVYTTTVPHDFSVGDYVFITGIMPIEYNVPAVPGQTITAVTEDTFTIPGTSTLTYVSGGSVRGKSAANPDLGFAAGYNDGTYHHAGFFRDASDGYWKVFEGYEPEPDESPFIDTADASFSLAKLEASAVKVGNGGIEFTDGVQNKIGVPSLTSFVYKTSSYTLDTLSLRDQVIEVSSLSATTITIPNDTSINFPIGTSIDILQTNTGQVTIAAAGGVTMNGTPGFKLRTQWSSATILKRANNTWIVYGDLAL